MTQSILEDQLVSHPYIEQTDPLAEDVCAHVNASGDKPCALYRRNHAQRVRLYDFVSQRLEQCGRAMLPVLIPLELDDVPYRVTENGALILPDNRTVFCPLGREGYFLNSALGLLRITRVHVVVGECWVLCVELFPPQPKITDATAAHNAEGTAP